MCGNELCDAHTILFQDPWRRLFPYRLLDERYSFLRSDQEVNLAAFWKGQLMGLVERNAKEAAKV